MNGTVRVYVKTLDGKCLGVDYDPNDLTAAVKEAVASKIGAHPGDCDLLFAGRNTNSAKTLGDNGYNLRKDHSSVLRSRLGERNAAGVQHLLDTVKMLEKEEAQKPDPRRRQQIKEIRDSIRLKLAFIEKNSSSAAEATRNAPNNGHGHKNAGLDDEAAFAIGIAASTEKQQKRVNREPQIRESHRFVVPEEHANAWVDDEAAFAAGIAASLDEKASSLDDDAAIAAGIAASLDDEGVDIVTPGYVRSGTTDPWEMYNQWAC